MRVTRIQHLIELTSYVDDWNRLAGGTPFMSWTWQSAWWKHYGTEHDLFVLVVHDDYGNVRGFAPWYIETSKARGRRIKFLGMGHVCSDYLRILARESDVEDVTTALALWLKDANAPNPEHEVDGWDFLSFEGVSADEKSMIRLRQELEALGHGSKCEPTLDCWRNEIGPDWDSYVGGLSKKNRRKVRDVRKKYVDVGRTEFAYAKDKAQFAEFYEAFVELHQNRWTSRGEEGCFASSEFASFVRDVSGSYFQQGELLLSRLLIDGKLAACSLGILSEGIHYMYQTGMNPTQSQHSPGWIMNVHSVMFGHENGIKAIDYLRGDEPYKAKLGAKPIEMVKFRIVANQAGAKVRNTVWQMRTNIRESGLTALNFPWAATSPDSETPQT